MLKVYFAGSIRGGRADVELYKRIIQYIQRNHIVLTEHVGDLSLSKTEGLKDRDVAIYEQDTAWLRESDVVIAECSTPSLGVGYELAADDWLHLRMQPSLLQKVGHTGHRPMIGNGKSMHLVF